MIPAQHKIWADIIFNSYLNRLYRKHFHSLSILGDIPEVKPDLPLLLLPNHSTWWDGFFVYTLNKKILHRELYVMMLEQQLKRFSFFTKVGAFSIDPGSFEGVKMSLQYANHVLSERKNVLLCLFAQGVLSPWFKRPLEFQRGVEKIVKNYGKKINILSLGIKALFLEEQHAQVFFRFGSCDQVDKDSFKGVHYYEEQCEYLLDQIIADISIGQRGQVIFSGAHSLSDRVESIQTRFNFFGK
jgi:hypothetical protein